MLKHAPSEAFGKATLCGLIEGYCTGTFLMVDCPDCSKAMAAPAKVKADSIDNFLDNLPEFEVVWKRNAMLSLDGLAPRYWYRAEIYHLLHFGPDAPGGAWESDRGALYDVIESGNLRWLTSITIRKYDAKFALRVIEE